MTPAAPGSTALRYFQAVARSGSFRRAAEELRIAPSALSRQVRRLEEELGAALLDRAPDGVTPTPAGEALLHRLDRAAQELDAARAEIRALQGSHRGHVVIGANETAAREVLARFLAGFRATHPAISFEVVVANTSALLARLAAGEVEVVLGYGVPPEAPVERLVAFDLVTCVMVNRDHRLARRAAVALRDLLGETLILPDSGTQLRRMLDALLARAAARPASALTTGSFELMGQFVALGLGVGVQVRIAPGPDPLRPDIVYVPLAERALKPVTLACCLRPGRPLPRAARLCASALAKALQEWGGAARQASNAARPSGVGG